MKLTLPNGMELRGTEDQVLETARKLGYDPLGDSNFYFSKSQGLVRISSMNTMHLRNAILSYYSSWVSDLHKIRNPRVLVEKLQEGITDPTWVAMVREYRTRPEV